ncbi:hypothetical protein SXCC_04377 [Gluconacetobacter sp. SXCC-1]|nr:hypothetical protein SXCC_04377 [Gluconacetobacter sp. SXCC-1]
MVYEWRRRLFSCSVGILAIVDGKKKIFDGFFDVILAFTFKVDILDSGSSFPIDTEFSKIFSV